MKMLLNCAQTLPLWIGTAGEKPPPLCGAVAPEQNYVAKVRMKHSALYTPVNELGFSDRGVNIGDGFPCMFYNRVIIRVGENIS